MKRLSKLYNVCFVDMGLNPLKDNLLFITRIRMIAPDILQSSTNSQFDLTKSISFQKVLGSSAESEGKLIAKGALPAFSNIE